MKRFLLPLVITIISIISCQRILDEANALHDQTDKPKKDKDTCEVLAQSGAYIEAEPRSAVFGFRKVVNGLTNRVDSLITASGGTFDVDSFFYHFEYLDNNVVHVDGVVLTYNRANSEQVWQLSGFSPIDQNVQLNAANQATAVMNGSLVLQQFNYNNGRLTSVDFPNDPAPFNHTAFTYDDHGNLVQAKRGDDQNNFSITFTYDLTKTAEAQVYSPLIPFQLYEIMGWIPVLPVNLRTSHLAVNHSSANGDQVIADITYSNHVVDKKIGALQSFDAHIGVIDVNATIVNTLQCEKIK
jgi:hypothetical protein